MPNKKALTYIISVLSATYLYSIVFFFIPLKKMNEICLYEIKGAEGTFCGINAGLVFLGIYMFIPVFTALVLQKFVYKEPLKNIGFTFKKTSWYIFPILVPLLIAVLGAGISFLFPGVDFTPDMSGFVEKYQTTLAPEQIAQMQEQMAATPFEQIFLMMVVQALIAGITLNALFAFGEEAGWRGFLISNLKEMGFYSKSFIIGLVWGVWHLPVIIQGYNYPEHPAAGVFMMILWCVLMSPLFTYAYEKTGSVISAALFHGMVNATAGFGFIFARGGNDLIVGTQALSGILAYAGANIVLYIYEKYYAKDKVIT